MEGFWETLYDTSVTLLKAILILLVIRIIVYLVGFDISIPYLDDFALWLIALIQDNTGWQFFSL